MTYSYDRREVLAKTTPEEFWKGLNMFERVLGILEQAAPKITSDYGYKITLDGAFKQLAPHLRMLFLNILTDYSLDAKDRKIVEEATKSFSKRLVVRKGQWQEAYSKILDAWRTYFKVAERIVENGKGHEESGTSQEAGPFTLVNTGGFSDKVMTDVAQVVQQSAKLLQKKGLGKLCYGKIQVTNTIQRSTRVLAFYQRNTDELYIRANFKGGKIAAVRSVCHELGHRLFYKFLQSKKNEIQRIYVILKGQESDRVDQLVGDKSAWPSLGEEYQEGRRTFIVDDVNYLAVRLYQKDDPSRRFKLPLKSWMLNKMQDATSGTFVSRYASTDPSENFAEMIAFYAQDLLPEAQVNMLEGIL
jgi:hypothetical protein